MTAPPEITVVAFSPAPYIDPCKHRPFPFEQVVEGLLQQPPPVGWMPTGRNRNAYLDVMEPVVREAATWVNETGELIDPVARKETGQTSSRFASSAAILLHFGRIRELQDILFRVMDSCCRRLPTADAHDYAPDFWMRELATAFMVLRGVAPPERLEQWRTDLATLVPEATYRKVDPTGKHRESLGNWCVYSSSGECLRAAAGLGPREQVDWLWGRDFFSAYMSAQMGEFTTAGMYCDPGTPITYDITTRLQFATALALDPLAPMRPVLEEVLRRGGLSTLLFVGPDGHVPFGGRSSQFQFQEAMLSALCELEARRYRISDPALAGAFKRQARRGAQAVEPWILGLRPFRHLKNGFPPESRHGADLYGTYSVYSLLMSSFFGLAALFADDTIAEAPTPSELGGYAIHLAPAFNKVFASCGGSYVELELAADPHYDATGLGRVLFAGLPFPLALGMPFTSQPKYLLAERTCAPRESVAIGPEWNVAGRTMRLAAIDPQDLASGFSARESTPQRVAFTASYRHALSGSVVEEAYVLERGTVLITGRVRVGDRPVAALSYLVPVLVADGAERAEQALQPGELVVRYRGHAVRYTWDQRWVRAAIEDGDIVNRNGVYRVLRLVSSAHELSLQIACGSV